MSSVSTIALVILSVVSLNRNGQDLCESYRRNDFRVIMITERGFHFILMVIDRHFWRLRDQNETLVFDPIGKVFDILNIVDIVNSEHKFQNA